MSHRRRHYVWKYIFGINKVVVKGAIKEKMKLVIGMVQYKSAENLVGIPPDAFDLVFYKKSGINRNFQGILSV